MADLQWATTAKDLATTAAIVVGGLWALYRFVLSRDHASNLYLSWTHDIHAFSENVSTVFITLRLENRGKKVLCAKPRSGTPTAFAPAYQDQSEILQHACGLQFRDLAPLQASGHISWYGLADSRGIGEINILEEFETSSDGAVDFQLEPGEIVEITIPVNLPKAHYIAKVHFVGAGGRMEYWSKLFWLRADGVEPSERPLLDRGS